MAKPLMNTWEGELDKANGVLDAPPERGKALLGWNGVVIWDKDVDPVDFTAAYIEKAKSESCGQCFPCRYGTERLDALIKKICAGQGSEKEIDRIYELSAQISSSARCDIGRSLAKPIRDMIGQFKDDFLAVAKGERAVKKGSYQSLVTAPCMNACPSNVDIPLYLEGVRLRRWNRALATVRNDCLMAGTIGRVCVRPCESNCRRGQLDESLSIRHLKRFLADNELATGKDPQFDRLPEKAERVAVVGAGPAGLSCAFYLGKQGYKCTVFEAQEGPGGMAAYGIPSYRLPREILAYESSLVEKVGGEIKYGVRIGEDISMDDLTAQGYRAIFLAMGAPAASSMRCEGEDAGYENFMTGVDFLAEASRGKKPLEGKTMLVIGGGNVAMDCVRTARRLGFEDVNLLYRRTEAEMPADAQEIREAREEGVIFNFLMAPKKVVAENGKVVGLECQRMELGEPDASGRRRPEVVEGSEFIFKCDAIIPAVGQVCEVDAVLSDKDSVTKWKTLIVDELTFQSSQSHVFGGGDCATGPFTLIAALAAGKRSARFIDRYLQEGHCRIGDRYLLRQLMNEVGVFDSEEKFIYPGLAEKAHPVALFPDTRIDSFAEVEKGFTQAQAVKEAARCLRCYRIVMKAI